MATPGILLNTVTVNTQSGSLVLRAGSTISDASVLAALPGSGGTLGPTTDPLIAAAALIVAKLRSRGQDEKACDSVMQAAAAESAGSLKFLSTTIPVNSSGTYPLAPEPAPRAGTLVGGTVIFEGTPASGESAALQFRKNASNITGALVTYNSSSTAKVPIAVPSLTGVTYVAGDVFDYVVTYTPGGTPALTGANADHAVLVQGTP